MILQSPVRQDDAPPVRKAAAITPSARLGAGLLLAVSAMLCAAPHARAQSEAPAAKAPDAIDLFFDTGSSAIREQDKALLDHASRLYNDGKPIVMIVAGSTDATGSPAGNLRLSEARADHVVHALVARGIPAERLQILAKGESELPAGAGAGADERDRRVQITWR